MHKQYYLEAVIWPDARDGRFVIKRPGQGTQNHIYYMPVPGPSDGDVFYIWLLIHNGATPRGLDLETLKVSFENKKGTIPKKTSTENYFPFDSISFTISVVQRHGVRYI
jgi:hypothetical protein